MNNRRISVRPVTSDDAQAIVDIYNLYILNSTASFETVELSVQEMRKRITDIASIYPYYVCEADGTVVGYCYAHPWKARAAYRHTLETTVYIHPEYHGIGIGRILMDILIKECRKVQCRALIACITAENKASIILHRKLGFKQVSLFRSVGFKFDRWLDVVDMELVLV